MRWFKTKSHSDSNGSLRLASKSRVFGLVLFCLVVFVALSQAATVTYVVAHFPYGGGWITRDMFGNPGAAAVTVDVAFFNQDGSVASVPLDGAGTQSTQHFTIAPNSVQVMAADPTLRLAPDPNNLANVGPIHVTWARVTSSGPLNVFSLFDDATSTVPSTQPTTLINGSVGAQSLAAATTFRLPISVYGPLQFNAGVAIANPNSVASNVVVILLNPDGTKKKTLNTMTLAAMGQTSFVVTQPNIFGNDIDPSTVFNGSLAVCSSQPVGLVGIGIEGGALFTIPATNDPCP